jgi:uncharacterized membrane protein
MDEAETISGNHRALLKSSAIGKLALTWLSCLFVFLALDAVWLGIVGTSFYTRVLGDLMLDGFRIVPAALFYPLHITGIVVFALPLAHRSPRLWASIAYGAFFGVCAYGTYDLTNHAVLRVWTWQLTVVDMIWGAFATAAASFTGAWMDRRQARRGQ